MRRQHFEALQPICPVCRLAKRTDSRLHIGIVIKEEHLNILEGVLQCHDPACLREYPIIDGIPLLLCGIRDYIASQVMSLYGRVDLSDVMEGLIGECCGPVSLFDQNRQHLSSYVWDHYGDLDPSYHDCVAASRPQLVTSPQPGGVVRALEDVWQAALPVASGPIIDLGCSVGRTTFEIAAETDEYVVGVDLNFSMLRWATRTLHESQVDYRCREVGMVYRPVKYPVKFRHSEKVDFWACDALALPFADQQFPVAVALNLIDCLPNPVEFLGELGRILQPRGRALLTTPFDWSPTATPIEAWLGGHSARSIDGGQSETVLRRLLASEQGRAQVGLDLIDAGEAPPWHVRLHARSTMLYQNHRIVLQSSRPELQDVTTNTTTPRYRANEPAARDDSKMSSANLA